MRYRVGDTLPNLEWLSDEPLAGATVVATYARSDGTTVSRTCALTTEVIQGRTFGVVTLDWQAGDLSVPGVGYVTLRWTGPGPEQGTLHPAAGWRVEVLP